MYLNGLLGVEVCVLGVQGVYSSGSSVGGCLCPLASYKDVGVARLNLIDHRDWAPSGLRRVSGLGGWRMCRAWTGPFPLVSVYRSKGW